MTKVVFSISLLNFFPMISFKPLSAEEAYTAKVKLKISFNELIYLYFCIQKRTDQFVEGVVSFV